VIPVQKFDVEEGEQRLQGWLAVDAEERGLNGLVEDVKKYAELLAADPNPVSHQEFRDRSAAFKLGLIFETNREPEWMRVDRRDTYRVGRITQCSRVDSAAADGQPQDVVAYNTRRTSFFHHPPHLDDPRHYASASTVAITWDLKWPDLAEVEAEDHLRYYRVTRRPLGFEGAEREFRVRPAALLLREEANGPVVSLPARFKFVDHFRDESDEEIAELPAQGRSYLYTITPVDLAGQASAQRRAPTGPFGGRSEANGRKLLAQIRPDGGSHSSRCRVAIRVVSTDPSKPLTGKVKLYLHPTFGQWSSYEIDAIGGMAEDTIVSYGAFTIGAEADDGKTRLELDLIDVPGGTKRFYDE
jgi:hypothetical protein